MAKRKRKVPQRGTNHDERPGTRRDKRQSASSKEESSTSYVADTEQRNKFGGNSIEWYSRYPNLLLGAGSIPYPYKPGMLLPVGELIADPSSTTDDPVIRNVIIPGIWTINWLPSVGFSTSPTSPISVVGKEIYARVREKFSGSLEADAPDFVIYLMALDSIFSYIAMLKRLYRILNAYSPENLFTPDGILSALGYDSSQIADLRQDKLLLFQRINELVLMTRKFKCPRIMDVFNRHVWLNDHIYTDAPTIKAQFYMFNQLCWYKFALVDVPHVTPTVQAGGLVYASPFQVNGFGNKPPETGVVNYLFNFGRSLIDALAASDDAYIISGYLMRAYEGYPDFVADELLLGETLIPKYNEEVLGEIENSHTLPTTEGGTVSAIVAQDPSSNAIICQPKLTIGNDYRARLHVDGMYPRISSRSDTPVVAETVINSRLMSYLTEFTGDGNTPVKQYSADILACTEIVMSYQITTQATAEGLRARVVTISSEIGINANPIPDAAYTVLQAIMNAASFDWAPLLWLMFIRATNSTAQLVGDMHNITTFSKEALRNLNTVCLYSLFNAFSV